MRRASIVAAAVSGLLLLPSAASAARPSLLVLTLEAPDLSPDLAEALDTAVRKEAESLVPARMKVMPRPALDFEGMRLASGCTDDSLECLSSIAKTLNVTHVLRATILGDGSGGARSKLILLEVGKKPKVFGGDLGAVDAASAVELRLHVAGLFGVKREVPPGSIELFIASNIGKLEGAEITLDQNAVNADALDRVAPGEHKIEIKQTGFEPFLWSGVVRPGRETRVGVNFEPSKAAAVAVAPPVEVKPAVQEPPPVENVQVVETPVAKPDEGPSYLLPAILGGAAVVAGLIGLQQGLREVSIRSDLETFCADGKNIAACTPDVCTGRPADCEEARGFATRSTIFWVAGGVLAAGSIALYLIESASSDEPAAFEAAPSEGGASFTLRF